MSPAPDAGTVTFTDGGAPISGCSAVALSVAMAGQAVCQTAFAQAGTHELAASYSGDALYAASASAALEESITAATATAVGGGSSAPPAPQHRVVRPVISHASISPRHVTAAHTPTLRLTMSEAATLHVAITRLRPGHVVAHRCSSKLHGGKPCLVRMTLAHLHFHARAGPAAFKLSLRKFAPGHYTAVIYATDDAGRRSRTIRIRFTIVGAQR